VRGCFLTLVLTKLNEMREKLKIGLGFLLLPLAFIIWLIDRCLMVLMPQLDHKNFTEWLDAEKITFAIIRILILLIIRWVLNLFFGI
jgi:hypothetical protein